MKPYLLISGDFVKTGGQDRGNYALASYLAHQGAEVHLVANRVADDLLAFPNVTFHRSPKPANSYFLGEPFLNFLGHCCAAEITRRGGRVLVNGGNCTWGDVNWVHYVHAAYPRHVDGSPLRRLQSALAHRRYLSMERRSLNRARVILADSERTRDDLIRCLGLPPEKIHVVYYGIDPASCRPPAPGERNAIRDRLGWPRDVPVVTFIGALGDRRKGFDLLFAAWKILCQDPRWDACLAVVGTGAELPTWKSRSASAGMSDRIRFLGHRADVPEILRAADALVSPTRYEPYGLAVHEALCCGIPAFVTESAGVAERYPAELADLLLSRTEDADVLAGKLRHWRSKPDRWSEPLASLSERWRSCTWEHMAQQMLSIVENHPEVAPESVRPSAV